MRADLRLRLVGQGPSGPPFRNCGRSSSEDTDSEMETSGQEVQQLWKEREGGGLGQGQELGCSAA